MLPAPDSTRATTGQWSESISDAKGTLSPLIVRQVTLGKAICQPTARTWPAVQM